MTRVRRVKGGIAARGHRLKVLETWGFGTPGALPRGNRIVERLGHLLVDEFQRKTFLEVSHHAGLHLAKQDQRFQRRAVFRADRGARGGEVDDAAGHLAAVLEYEYRNRVARHDTVVAAVFRQVEDIAVG